MASKVFRDELDAKLYASRWMGASPEMNGCPAPDFHFSCWWLRVVFWRKTLCITIEGNVYCRQDYITGRIIRHECTHVWQWWQRKWKFYFEWVFGSKLEREAVKNEEVNTDI